MSEGIPDSWKEYKLCTLFSLHRENIEPNIFPDEVFEYYSIPAWDEYGRYVEVNGKEIQSNKVLISKPTVLVSKLNPRKPRVILVEGVANRRRCASTEFMPYVANIEDVHLPFYKWYFVSGYFHERLERVATGSTNSHIRVSPKETLRWQVPLPPKPEQQKIASILTSVDEVIERTEAQIGKLQDLKKGMMQELLTKGISHTEFKDSPIGRIPKEWDVTTYNSVLTKIDSGWSPNCIELPPDIGEWGVLKVSAVTRDRFIELESKTLPRALEPRESIRVTRDDILLTRANGVAELVGKCVKVAQEPKRKLMMSDKILRLSPNKRIYSEFLLHIFNSQLTRTQIEQSWGGSSGQKNISQANIKSFLLPLPSLKEQQAMGDTLSSIDNSVDSKLLKLKHHIALKNALMQDLLTGKVRVSVN